MTATAPYSKGITAAAERDWHPISCQYVQAHWVATHLPKYLDGLRNAGKPADPLGWRVAKCIFVADDAAAKTLTDALDDSSVSITAPQHYIIEIRSTP